jgi:hypothetical protein
VIFTVILLEQFKLLHGCKSQVDLNLNVAVTIKYLGKDYSAEVSGWFNGPGLWGATGKTNAQGSLDIGLQKKLLNKKLIVKLSATDLLATASPWRINSNFSGLIINGNGTWESRTVRVNLTYQFGSSQIKSARQRQTGLEDEKKRLKG